MGALNAGRVGTNRDCRPIAGYRSMTAGRANNKCDNVLCSKRLRRINESIFITACMTMMKRRQENRIYFSGTSEVELVLDVLYY